MRAIERSRVFLQSACAAVAAISSFAVAQVSEPFTLPTPTYANVSYGPHVRHVLHFWQASTATPTPLAIYFYGGGWRQGSIDQSSSQMGEELQELLDAGISVASVDYRLFEHAPHPAAFEDAAAALKFLRTQADAWGFDDERVATFGESSGAQLAMWLAFHEDMAIPDASESLDRQSTRVLAVASRHGQTTMEPALLRAWLPEVELTEQQRTGRQYAIESISDDSEEQRRVLADMAAYSNLSLDDPPIFLTYSMSPSDPIPSNHILGEGGWQIHHVNFGVKLKEKADRIGVEAHLSYPGSQIDYESMADFLRAKLLSD